MKHINELGRSRPFNLYNLLPEEISKKEPPIFFIPTHNINCDFLSANLNKSQNFHPDKPKKKLKKAVHTSTTIAHFSNKNNNSNLSLIY